MIFGRFFKKNHDEPEDVPEQVEEPTTEEAVTPEFGAFVERLKAETTIPSILIRTNAVDSLPLTASKFFGEPYLPRGAEHPTDNDGNRLGFLAQIRLEDLPDNDQFPASGLLQFWIGTDDVMGLDFKEMTDNRFAVLYYPTVDETVTETAYVAPNEETDEEEYFSPYIGDKTFALTFTATEQPMSLEDYRFESLALPAYNEAFPEDRVDHLFKMSNARYDYLAEQLRSTGHRLGGYPFFTQVDPRDEGTDLDFMLFQMDSDDEVMWGDSGVGNFFINSDKLRNADFSQVGYNWDCH